MGHEDGLTIILYILKLIRSAGTCPHKGACSSATDHTGVGHRSNECRNKEKKQIFKTPV